MDYRFGKEYKLCRKKLMEELFAASTSVKKYPFILHYKLVDEPLEKPFQMVIAAPKRIFKHAVQRNRVKRICREIVRHEKHDLEEFLTTKGKFLTLFLVYTAKEELSQELLTQKFRTLVERLKEKLNE